MSENRRTTGNLPGIDCPGEITFAEFLEIAQANGGIMRVQGKVEDRTKKRGRLVRFNRSVLVLGDTAATNRQGHPYVKVERVRWNWRKQCFAKTGKVFTVTWRLLDWVTTQACNDPNGTWMKVVQPD